MDPASVLSAETVAPSRDAISVEHELLRLNPVVELSLPDREAIGRGTPLHFGPTFVRFADLHRDLGFAAAAEVSDVRRLIQAMGAAPAKAVRV
jgi:hypothetical protein